MRSVVITGMSFMLTSLVLGNAYIQKKQFYPSVVYITKSNPSMAIIYMQALVFVVLTGKMLRKVFFGQLRAAEMEHLIERSWYALTETCLAFTVFRDDFSPRFVALFTLLLFLKCFHWLAEDRIDFMERSPAISWLFHLRAIALMLLLGVLDALFVRHAFYSIILKGPSVQLVFGFEYEILFTVVVMMFIKYIAHSIDLQSENPWDNKAIYLLYAELIMGFVRVVLYILFVIIMIKVHTFPLFAIRPMYLTLRAFQKAAQDVVLSRRAIRHMNTLYPDATPEELSAGDNSCIICREEMTTGCKKLPCNHIFHTSCLRSWFQRQQTCPTCRLEVLRVSRPDAQQQRAQQQQAQQQPQNQPPPPVNPFNNMQGMFGGFGFQWPPNAGQPGAPPPPFGWPPQQQQDQQQQQQQQQPATSTTTPATSSTPASGSGIQQPTTTAAAGPSTSTTTSQSSSTSATATANGMPGMSMPFGPMPGMGMGMGMPMYGMGMGMPPMMPPMFNAFGFPPPPQPMNGLNEEELRAMEGVERSNVEARIHWLRDIQALLDGAMLLIGQYNAVASQMGSQGIDPTAPPAGHQNYSSPQASSSSSPTAASSSTESASSYQLPHPTWWPANQGARPKYTSTLSKTHTSSLDGDKRPRSSSISRSDEGEGKAKDEPEGAEGYTPPKEEMIPSWENPLDDEKEESMHEIRKRRLQHFEQQPGKPQSSGDVESEDSGHS